jgi:hypothetical protein
VVELLVVGVAALVALATLLWVQADPPTLFWTAVGGLFVAGLVYLDWADSWVPYVYAGLTLAWVGWLLLPGSDEEVETRSARLLGLVWRTPVYWLAGLAGGFFAVLVGGLVLFLVVALPGSNA